MLNGYPLGLEDLKETTSTLHIRPRRTRATMDIFFSVGGVRTFPTQILVDAVKSHVSCH